MTAIWLLDVDGVVNALSERVGVSIWSDWSSAVVDHPYEPGIQFRCCGRRR